MAWISASIPYEYVDHGGTGEVRPPAGRGPEHDVVKTLVMEDERAQPLIVLMHGDCSVSTKNLARQIGCKSVQPCKPEVAQRHSGFMVGGTSPFGTVKSGCRSMWRRACWRWSGIYINGGRRGYLVSIAPEVPTRLLEAKPVECALPD